MKVLEALRFSRLQRTLSLHRVGALTLAWLAIASPTVFAQGNIEGFGVPPIPSSLANEVQPYAGIYGLPVAGWNPTKREIWLKGLSSVTWISKVKSPSASPETSSIYIQSPGIY